MSDTGKFLCGLVVILFIGVAGAYSCANALTEETIYEIQ